MEILSFVGYAWSGQRWRAAKIIIAIHVASALKGKRLVLFVQDT
jgi:hypothetical protein